ncbi:hypothetical protein [Photobacterium marinum]|uniref:hypothetical protein n=1 Tax=Photobacterium marinum TaxID=1056511 RepID=UPI0012FAAB0C|nr:hypothetical protein [Photobacterium marinum]
MRSAVKTGIIIYVTCSFLMSSYIALTNVSNTPDTLKKPGIVNIHAKSISYQKDKTYLNTESDTINRDDLGFMTVSTSISNDNNNTLRHTSYSVLFTNENTFLTHPQNTRPDNRSVQSKLIQHLFPKREFFKILYDDGNFICITGVGLHLTSCREVSNQQLE